MIADIVLGVHENLLRAQAREVYAKHREAEEMRRALMKSVHSTLTDLGLDPAEYAFHFDPETEKITLFSVEDASIRE